MILKIQLIYFLFVLIFLSYSGFSPESFGNSVREVGGTPASGDLCVLLVLVAITASACVGEDDGVLSSDVPGSSLPAGAVGLTGFVSVVVGFSSGFFSGFFSVRGVLGVLFGSVCASVSSGFKAAEAAALLFGGRCATEG